jgi:hypothetical protein
MQQGTVRGPKRTAEKDLPRCTLFIQASDYQTRLGRAARQQHFGNLKEYWKRHVKNSLKRAIPESFSDLQRDTKPKTEHLQRGFPSTACGL